MRNIKGIIIVLSILLILIFGYFIIQNYKTDTHNQENIESKENQIKEELILEDVTSATAYFTVESCVNKYINYVSEKDIESILILLDSEYIKNNAITKDNVLNKIEEMPQQVTFETEKMYVEEIDENNNRYYVSGVLKQEVVEDEDLIKGNLYIAITLNFENTTFSVMPLEDGGIFNEKNN